MPVPARHLAKAGDWPREQPEVTAVWHGAAALPTAESEALALELTPSWSLRLRPAVATRPGTDMIGIQVTVQVQFANLNCKLNASDELRAEPEPAALRVRLALQCQWHGRRRFYYGRVLLMKSYSDLHCHGHCHSDWIASVNTQAGRGGKIKSLASCWCWGLGGV